MVYGRWQMPARLRVTAFAGRRLTGESITWNLFAVLGVTPAIGRSFLPDEDRPGREHVVILSDALWHARFAADRSIIGRAIVGG
jgi:hypothetical protein